MSLSGDPIGAARRRPGAVERKGLFVVGVDPLLAEQAAQQAGLLLTVDAESLSSRVSHRPSSRAKQGTAGVAAKRSGPWHRDANAARCRMESPPAPHQHRPRPSARDPRTGTEQLPCPDVAGRSKALTKVHAGKPGEYRDELVSRSDRRTRPVAGPTVTCAADTADLGEPGAAHTLLWSLV